MLYMLLGQDDFSSGESLEEIKRGMGDPALLSANTTVLEGQQVTLDRLRNVCETVPFLAERRLVIIRGLLERFESKGKSGRQKKAVSSTNQQNESELWASCLSNIPDSTVLALVDDRVSGNNPLFCALSVRAEVKSFPLLRGIKLRQWIGKRVRREGDDISPEAIDLLAKLVGSNLWIMKNEIDKLTLLTSGRRIEAEDVNKVVSYAQQDSVFAMVDAVLEFKAGIAEKSLKRLLERGATPAYLLVMLSRQVRMITRVRGLKNQGKSEKEIQTRLGLTLEFAFRRTLEQASKYPLARIKEVYHKLLETDLSIKTGKYEGELALNILVAELCQRAVNR